MAKMSEHELRTILEQNIRQALDGDYSELKYDRQKAIDAYLGRPIGNEIDGRSQIVSKDVLDTIEWALPSLLRVFISDEVVSVEPTGPEDEKQAEQEARYLTYLFSKQNRGFHTLYTWFKDALLQKVGYVKTYWEDSEDRRVTEFSGLTEDQLLMLMQRLGDNAEVVEKEYRTETIDGQEMQLCDIRIRMTEKKGRVVIENVPPEQMIVHSKTTDNLKDSPFVAQRVRKTRSDLILEGFDPELVARLNSYDSDSEYEEEVTRDTVNESTFGTFGSSDTTDDSAEEIELVEAYILIDYDGDGIAERRRILTAGNEVLENEEVDYVPFSSLCPIPMPHRHVGLSLYDLIEDLSKAKTALWRQLLDNTYLSNNTRFIVNQNNVNISDLLNSRPGGIIRTMGTPGADVVPLQHEPIINKVLPVLDYLDGTKENRTGVGKMTNGLDPDVLQNATKGAFDVATSAAGQRLEAIARIFAETGVRDMFIDIHNLITRHQDWSTQVKLDNQWVPVDPSTWRERTDITISVGLGTNSREEKRQSLMLIAQTQQQAAQAGVVLPHNVYALAETIAKELGFPRKGVFFTDPQSPEMQQYMQNQQPQKNPLVEAEEMKQQGQSQRQQTDMQVEIARLQAEKTESDRDHARKIAEMELKYQADIGKAGQAAELKMLDLMERQAGRMAPKQ